MVASGMVKEKKAGRNWDDETDPPSNMPTATAPMTPRNTGSGGMRKAGSEPHRTP